MDALVVIDLQRWMFRMPERLAQVDGILSSLSILVSRFEQAKLPIYDVVTIHRADKSTWSRLMLKHDYPCLIEGTPDAEPIPEYSPPPSASRIVKTQNSAFLDTGFEARLRADDVTKLMLTGVFMDGCVALTAADAAQRGFEVTCVADAVGHADAAMRLSMEKWLDQMYEIEHVQAHTVLA
jgi:nicotinamidase-related amidase